MGRKAEQQGEGFLPMEGREKVPRFALNLTRSLDESVRSLLSCRRPAGGGGRGRGSIAGSLNSEWGEGGGGGGTAFRCLQDASRAGQMRARKHTHERAGAQLQLFRSSDNQPVM